MLSPIVWNNLPETEKVAEFEKLKTLAGIKSKKCVFWVCGDRIDKDRDYIYRPLLPLLEGWAGFKELLEEHYPDGESTEFHDKLPTLENYTTLYNWLDNRCEMCGSSNVNWDQGDKSIVTYCPDCRNEKFFVKGCWY